MGLSSALTIGSVPAPRACGAFLLRKDLAASLRHDPARLVVINAPVGCGKSMLLLSLATVACDEIHWSSLEQFDHAPRTGVLLIDNAQFPKDDPEQADLVARLEARLAHQRIVIASQESLKPGPLVVFFAGQARLLGPADLAFTPQESTALFNRPDDALEVEHWHHFVEGWSLGVAIGATDPQAALALMRWGGDQRRMPRALATVFETILASSDTDLAMDLAAFGNFPLTVLPELPQRPGHARKGRAALDCLLNDRLWLRDCDRRAGWLHFMPAFARFLQERLKCHDPDRATVIRAFAVDWGARNHDLAQELRHGLALWSPHEALHRLDQAGALHLSLCAGPDLTLTHPLDATSAQTMPQAFFSLLYERIRHGAWIEARLHFDKAYRLTEGFTRFHTPQDQAVIEAWCEVFQCLFRVADDLPPGPDWHARLGVLRQNALGQHQILTMALFTLAVIIALDQGDRLLALRESDIGLQLCEVSPVPRAALFILLHRASALIASARIPEATQAIEDASGLFNQDDYADSYERVVCQIHAGLCAFEKGDAARAYELLVACAGRVARVHGWRRLWAELFHTLARLDYERQGRAAAEHWLERGRAFAWSNRQPHLSAALDLSEIDLCLRIGDLGSARALFDLRTKRLTQIENLAPTLHYQAQVLEIALLEAEGATQEACDRLDLVCKSGLEDCDLRLYLRFEVLALGLHQNQMETEVWQRRYNAAQRLAQSYPNLSTDPAVGLKLARLKRETAENTPVLSPREIQILTLIVDGLSSKEIARQLDIAEGTVKSHRKKIYSKFGVNMRSQAISRAREFIGGRRP